MKNAKIYIVLMLLAVSVSSCDQTTKKDNATGNKDTMVITQDKTDSATKSVSTDTTKR